MGATGLLADSPDTPGNVATRFEIVSTIREIGSILSAITSLQWTGTERQSIKDLHQSKMGGQIPFSGLGKKENRSRQCKAVNFEATRTL